MNMAPEVVCVGEALIDFVSVRTGVTLRDAPGFLKALGGAPANVAVGLARLGIRSAFVGKVGDDPFGRFITRELERRGVNVRRVVFDRLHKTRLAFVSLAANGERDFAFWETDPADAHLHLRDVKRGIIQRAVIVHCSSFMLLHRETRETIIRLADQCRRNGAVVCFDPNLRISLWGSRGEARRTMMHMVRTSTLVRMNDEESRFLTGTTDLRRAAARLRKAGPALVVITRGSKGCYFQTAAHEGNEPGFKVRPVDTTGCGDAFLAALLRGIVRRRCVLGELSDDDLHAICRFANAAGALASLKHGGAASMPNLAAAKRLAMRKTFGM